MKFKCSYAYDVPYYFDFTVEAESEAEAEQKIEKALEDGVFDTVTGDPSDDCSDLRVFVSGASEDTEDDGERNLQELIEQADGQPKSK